MSHSWRQAYTELTAFIAGHSEIEIGTFLVSIPESVRPEFYRLFGAVRVAFPEEKFSAWLSEAKTLSRGYITVEEEVTKLLGVADVTLPGNLHYFLRDPAKGLTRPFFQLLFDLLKGKTNVETFEATASQDIEASFGPLYRAGYAKWVGLSLARLLDADKAFHVTFPMDFEDKGHAGQTDFYSQVPVNLPEESSHLRFDLGEKCSISYSVVFLVPEFIVHSAKIDRYVAVSSAIRGDLKWSATNASDKREWYPLGARKRNFGPDYIINALKADLLIYIDDRPEDINLMADADRFCRPDLIIECREQKGWYEKQGLDEIKLHHDVLKPKLGTYIVSREPVSEQAYKELIPEQISEEPTPEEVPEKQGEAIHILTVGFDQSKLEPIINMLMSQKDEKILNK